MRYKKNFYVVYYTYNLSHYPEVDTFGVCFVGGKDGLKLRILSSLTKNEIQTGDGYSWLSEKGAALNARALEIMKGVLEKMPQEKRPRGPWFRQSNQRAFGEPDKILFADLVRK